MKSNLFNQNTIKRPWLLCVLSLTLLISFIYRDKSEFEVCLGKAESGDSNAQYIVGLMYFNGEGVEINFHNALQWLLKASKQENVNYQRNLYWGISKLIKENQRDVYTNPLSRQEAEESMDRYIESKKQKNTDSALHPLDNV